MSSDSLSVPICNGNEYLFSSDPISIFPYYLQHPLSPQESATEPSSSPKIMEIDETANPGEADEEQQDTAANPLDTDTTKPENAPIVEEPDDDTPGQEPDREEVEALI